MDSQVHAASRASQGQPWHKKLGGCSAGEKVELGGACCTHEPASVGTQIVHVEKQGVVADPRPTNFSTQASQGETWPLHTLGN